MSFQTSLKLGQQGEELLRKVLADAGIPSASNVGDNLSEWDIQADVLGIPFLIEAKFDLMEAKTGNVAIEYHNPKTGKPSGIMATKAHLWVIVLQEPVTLWVARSRDLKRYIQEKECVRDIECAGDKNASIKLYKRHTIFKDIFTRIDELAPWELSDLLISLLGSKYVRKSRQVMAQIVQDVIQAKGT